jgi:predicted lysophospholipase L1 biosynthesis ABC-type transport system permease subunit
MNCVSFVSHISHLFLATLLLTPWQDRVLVTATIALLAFALLVLLAWGKRRLVKKLEERRSALQPVKLRTLEILSGRQKFRFYRRTLSLAHLGAALLVISAALLGISAEFPATRG